MALEESGPAPYAPWTAIERVIDHSRDKGLSFPVTTHALSRLGVEDSLSRRTLAALKQLDLLDADGQETPTLERIRLAPTADFTEVLSDWLRNAYKPIFAHVEPSDDLQKITDQFRYYEPAGMRNRMVTLFLGLCTMAGLIPEMPILPRGRGAKKPGKAATPSAKKKAKQPAPPPRTSDPRSGTAKDRYVDFLLEKAKAQEEVDPDLLDRIERALGLGGVTP